MADDLSADVSAKEADINNIDSQIPTLDAKIATLQGESSGLEVKIQGDAGTGQIDKTAALQSQMNADNTQAGALLSQREGDWQQRTADYTAIHNDAHAEFEKEISAPTVVNSGLTDISNGLGDISKAVGGIPVVKQINSAVKNIPGYSAMESVSNDGLDELEKVGGPVKTIAKALNGADNSMYNNSVQTAGFAVLTGGAGKVVGGISDLASSSAAVSGAADADGIAGLTVTKSVTEQVNIVRSSIGSLQPAEEKTLSEVLEKNPGLTTSQLENVAAKITKSSNSDTITASEVESAVKAVKAEPGASDSLVDDAKSTLASAAKSGKIKFTYQGVDGKEETLAGTIDNGQITAKTIDGSVVKGTVGKNGQITFTSDGRDMPGNPYGNAKVQITDKSGSTVEGQVNTDGTVSVSEGTVKTIAKSDQTSGLTSDGKTSTVKFEYADSKGNPITLDGTLKDSKLTVKTPSGSQLSGTIDKDGVLNFTENGKTIRGSILSGAKLTITDGSGSITEATIGDGGRVSTVGGGASSASSTTNDLVGTVDKETGKITIKDPAAAEAATKQVEEISSKVNGGLNEGERQQLSQMIEAKGGVTNQQIESLAKDLNSKLPADMNASLSKDTLQDSLNSSVKAESAAVSPETAGEQAEAISSKTKQGLTAVEKNDLTSMIEAKGGLNSQEIDKLADKLNSTIPTGMNFSLSKEAMQSTIDSVKSGSAAVDTSPATAEEQVEAISKKVTGGLNDTEKKDLVGMIEAKGGLNSQEIDKLATSLSSKVPEQFTTSASADTLQSAIDDVKPDASATDAGSVAKQIEAVSSKVNGGLNAGEREQLTDMVEAKGGINSKEIDSLAKSLNSKLPEDTNASLSKDTLQDTLNSVKPEAGLVADTGDSALSKLAGLVKSNPKVAALTGAALTAGVATASLANQKSGISSHEVHVNSGASKGTATDTRSILSSSGLEAGVLSVAGEAAKLENQLSAEKDTKKTLETDTNAANRGVSSGSLHATQAVNTDLNKTNNAIKSTESKLNNVGTQLTDMATGNTALYKDSTSLNQAKEHLSSLEASVGVAAKSTEPGGSSLLKSIDSQISEAQKTVTTDTETYNNAEAKASATAGDNLKAYEVGASYQGQEKKINTLEAEKAEDLKQGSTGVAANSIEPLTTEINQDKATAKATLSTYETDKTANAISTVKTDDKSGIAVSSDITEKSVSVDDLYKSSGMTKKEFFDANPALSIHYNELTGNITGSVGERTIVYIDKDKNDAFLKGLSGSVKTDDLTASSAATTESSTAATNSTTASSSTQQSAQGSSTQAEIVKDTADALAYTNDAASEHTDAKAAGASKVGATNLYDKDVKAHDPSNILADDQAQINKWAAEQTKDNALAAADTAKASAATQAASLLAGTPSNSSGTSATTDASTAVTPTTAAAVSSNPLQQQLQTDQDSVQQDQAALARDSADEIAYTNDIASDHTKAKAAGASKVGATNLYDKDVKAHDPSNILADDQAQINKWTTEQAKDNAQAATDTASENNAVNQYNIDNTKLSQDQAAVAQVQTDIANPSAASSSSAGSASDNPPTDSTTTTVVGSTSDNSGANSAALATAQQQLQSDQTLVAQYTAASQTDLTNQANANQAAGIDAADAKTDGGNKVGATNRYDKDVKAHDPSNILADDTTQVNKWTNAQNAANAQKAQDNANSAADLSQYNSDQSKLAAANAAVSQDQANINAFNTASTQDQNSTASATTATTSDPATTSTTPIGSNTGSTDTSSGSDPTSSNSSNAEEVVINLQNQITQEESSITNLQGQVSQFTSAGQTAQAQASQYAAASQTDLTNEANYNQAVGVDSANAKTDGGNKVGAMNRYDKDVAAHDPSNILADDTTQVNKWTNAQNAANAQKAQDSAGSAAALSQYQSDQNNLAAQSAAATSDTNQAAAASAQLTSAQQNLASLQQQESAFLSSSNYTNMQANVAGAAVTTTPATGGMSTPPPGDVPAVVAAAKT